MCICVSEEADRSGSTALTDKTIRLWISAALNSAAFMDTEKKDPYQWPQSCPVLAYMGTLQRFESQVQTLTKITTSAGSLDSSITEPVS